MPKQGTQSHTKLETRSFVKRDRHGQWFVISTAKDENEAQVSEEWIKSTITYTVKP